MTSDETIAGDRERQLDAIVLTYLKAREDNPSLDQQQWMNRHPELQVELAAFFRDQDRIEQLAMILRQLTGAADTQTASDATLVWDGGAWPATAVKPRQILGDYELLQELGKGGMGVVYKARQRSLKRVVALKMILAGADASADQLTRFRGEAEAVARLQHPNIVQIYEVGELDQRPFFSLEFVEGGSLAAQLDGTPRPPRSAAELVSTLARAIHFAHQHGIIHRDLKPANVLLQITDRKLHIAKTNQSANYNLQSAIPKITDFGLAKRLDEESGQTKTGSILGTPSYMAPEQAAGTPHPFLDKAVTGRVGPATDIYGLGAILYELLTGRPPFKAATAWETVSQVLQNEPVSPRLLVPKVGRDLETICLKCLQKTPQRRYESAEALADDLQRYLEGRPILARPVLNTVKFWRWCRRNPATAGPLAFALASLVVLLIVTFSFNQLLRQELQENESINRKLQLTLTTQVADRIDSDLRQLTRIPTLMAATLSLRSDWDEKLLEAWTREMLSKDERMFGITVAFEPKQFDGKRTDFAQYVYRPKEGMRTRTKMLLLPDYKPHYSEWIWYRPALKQKSPLWTEPFIDIGGGDIRMMTYSVPIWRDGDVVGVVAADLSVAYFDVMRHWLNEVKLGNQGYAFVLSPTGTFINHPDPKYQMPLKITETKEFQAEETIQELTKRLLQREPGSVRAVDPYTGKASVFHIAPVRSAQWSLIVVAED